MTFDYYYGDEAEQFSFYRIPRLLIKDKQFKRLSSDAKLLYGLMLDRMSLSIKNGWLDENNRVYIIYTVDTIMEDLGCGKDKAIKILAELDSSKGIGLIARVRRGLGKPDIIYVKNFVMTEASNTNFPKSDLQKSEDQTSRSRESRLAEVGKIDLQKSGKSTSRGGENRLQEVGKSDLNYTNYNYTDYNYTDYNHTNQSCVSINYTNPINQSDQSRGAEQKKDMIDRINGLNTYTELIRKNLEYDHHMKYDKRSDKELFDEIYEIICEIVCVKRKTIRINGEDYPYDFVKSRFLKLDSGHVEYVMECMKDNVTKINNIRAYLITALYNAPATINHYYTQEVRHDMYGGYG